MLKRNPGGATFSNKQPKYRVPLVQLPPRQQSYQQSVIAEVNPIVNKRRSQNIVQEKNYQDQSSKIKKCSSKSPAIFKNQNSPTCKCQQHLQRYEKQKSCQVISLLNRGKNKSQRRQPSHISIDLDQLKLKKEKEQQTILQREKIKQKQQKLQKQLKRNEQEPSPSKKERIKSVSPLSRRKSSKDIRESLMNTSTLQTSSKQPSVFSFNNYIEAISKQSASNNSQNEYSIDESQPILRRLFDKLIANNPSEKYLNYLNFNYKILTMSELHFIGILFDRIEPQYLNSMDYMLFKLKTFQKCQTELQELVNQQTERKVKG